MRRRSVAVVWVGVCLMAAGCKWAAEARPHASGPEAESLRPLTAPAWFASADKNLLVPVPAGATYCPLPKDWVGSDHGTTLYLLPPATCGGVGYPSSSRQAGPAGAAISIFYGYDTVDPEFKAPPPVCARIGEVTLLGEPRPLCRSTVEGAVKVRVDTTYTAEGAEDGIASELSLELTTTAERSGEDIKVFRAMLEHVSLCTREAPREGNAGLTPCPGEARFF